MYLTGSSYSSSVAFGSNQIQQTDTVKEKSSSDRMRFHSVRAAPLHNIFIVYTAQLYAVAAAIFSYA